MYFASRPRSDVLILGAGVIGLSFALELRSRGFAVSVLDRGTPLAQASSAAAGMLAVHDPHNPQELLPLSTFSRSLYPAFLARLEALSGLHVPFQTDITWQTLPGGSVRRLEEHSIDPRQLAPALLSAARHAGVLVQANGSSDARLAREDDTPTQHHAVVYTTGAWSSLRLPVVPRKGQMMRVVIPPALGLREVYRSEHVYVVPRTHGPAAGTALIGATVEDAGFDLSTTQPALRSLREMGAALVPALGDAMEAPVAEAWAGLRPATPDALPILGEWNPSERAGRQFVATGHYRNGILLAPGTAAVMADLLEGKTPPVDLQPFGAHRFAAEDPFLPGSPAPADDIRSLRRDNRFGNLT